MYKGRRMMILYFFSFFLPLTLYFVFLLFSPTKPPPPQPRGGLVLSNELGSLINAIWQDLVTNNPSRLVYCHFEKPRHPLFPSTPLSIQNESMNFVLTPRLVVYCIVWNCLSLIRAPLLRLPVRSWMKTNGLDRKTGKLNRRCKTLGKWHGEA